METLDELRLSGNCLLYSRPLLLFSADFEKNTHLRVLKELFTQVGFRVLGFRVSRVQGFRV